MVKANHEVNNGIMACDWPVVWLTSWFSWFTLIVRRKDWPSVNNARPTVVSTPSNVSHILSSVAILADLLVVRVS